MKDYISRDAAIEAMYKDAEAHPGHTFWVTQLEALRSIPAADVREVKRGEWIRTSHRNCMGYKCSVCGAIFNKRKSRLNYCSSCGADMRPEPPKEET